MVFYYSFVCLKTKAAAFSETGYAIRIVEPRIEFPLFYVNCHRNVPVDI